MTSQFEKFSVLLCNRKRTVIVINIIIIAAIGYNVSTSNVPSYTFGEQQVEGRQLGGRNTGLRSLTADYQDEDSTSINVTKLPAGRSNTTQLLLVTYMRGGSTLLSELINRNPRALYWFEPVDGFYSSLYGGKHGWFPIDLLYYMDGRMRRLYDFEEEAIINGLNDIFSCNSASIPVDVLSNYQFTHIVGRKVAHFIKCLQVEYPLRKAPRPWECKGGLATICKRGFDISKAYDEPTMCHFCMNHYDFKTGIINVKNGSDTSVIFNSIDLAGMANKCKEHRTKFEAYGTCIEKSFKGVNACLPYIQSACHNSTIIAQKAIRLRADIVFKLLMGNPDLKVVYQVRDPRGIVPSRQKNGLLSAVSARKVISESRVLCQRMLYDISIIKNLKNLYPDRVLSVKYEDFVENPYEIGQQVYDLLQQPIPKEVTSWLTTMHHGNVTGKASAYNTIRTNSTATAYKWRSSLSKPAVQEMTRNCRDVLVELGYDL